MKRIRMVGKLKGKTHAELSIASDFYRPVTTNIFKVNDGRGRQEDSALRLYCEQAGTIWNLQIRGPIRLVNGQKGKDFIVAQGSLSVADMRALRDRIDAYLRAP